MIDRVMLMAAAEVVHEQWVGALRPVLPDDADVTPDAVATYIERLTGALAEAESQRIF